MFKLNILNKALKGELLKFKYNIIWDFYINNLKKICDKKKRIPVIVSLTSYGRRVTACTPYAILSILNGRVLPGQIILWLDSKNWTTDNIPEKIKSLSFANLQIKFTEDVKSYQKLVPAIKEYPSDHIVTIDDDTYYPPSFLERLYECHKKNPCYIISTHCRYPTFVNGKLSSYKDWANINTTNTAKQNKISSKLIFPLGYGGIWYPPDSLYPDVTNQSLFTEICPYADDIWFYMMGVIKGTSKVNTFFNNSGFYHLDLFRQIIFKDRLQNLNIGNFQNDIQLSRLLKHYDIDLKDKA